MYSLMNPLCWSRCTLINSHEQIPLFSQCCLDKLQFHLTLDSNFNSFHRTTVNTSLGIQWLNCKARSVSQLPPHAHPTSPSLLPLAPSHPHHHLPLLQITICTFTFAQSAPKGQSQNRHFWTKLHDHHCNVAIATLHKPDQCMMLMYFDNSLLIILACLVFYEFTLIYILVWLSGWQTQTYNITY